MKKILLTLGTVVAVAAPVASVIACGSEGDELPVLANGLKATKIITYNFSDDMSLAEYDKNAKEYGGIVEKVVDDLKKNMKTPIPLLKIVYEGKPTILIDWSADGHQKQDDFIDETKALGEKLGSQS